MNKKFIDEAVDAHNVYRSRHQVPPLTHSQELSQMAQAWAKELADTNSFKLRIPGEKCRAKHRDEMFLWVRQLHRPGSHRSVV